MGEQENCVRTTRASKKRSYSSVAGAAQALQQLPKTKKRVVLGDLTNTPSAELTQNFSDSKTQKLNHKPKKKKILKPQKTETVVSLDDPKNCAYASSIYDHLHSLEIEENRRPLANYMEKVQNDVTANMREILVDWLVEVAEEYKLVSDTLYLTVSYIDRYLSSNALNRSKLQLLGVSSMLVASKYEEISPPHVEDFCYITDNTYTKEEVVTMERDVLKFFNFEMGSPTTKTFLRSFTRVAQENCKSADLPFEFLGCYLAELSLLDYGCLRFLPSMIAASAIFLSRFTIQPHAHPWSLALQHYSGYTPSDLKECILAIHDLQLSRKGALRAVRDKYKQHKFKCVAVWSSPSEIPTSYFKAVNK
ncbi:putative cyclin-A3-1 [Malania oleifera]|uniref:putative cyclin-A3-1 n=1 Tax=Malania oleifera TaxID=397392 RepID=UPI0025ADCF96|nr:putative cyclin-A3-1 [Malania oleifera]